MQFFAFTLLTGLVAALPQASPPANTVMPPPVFKLQAKVIPGIEDCGTDKNGLWLTSFHTGAGLGDAVLINNRSRAMPAFFNGTDQFFGNHSDPNFTWPMQIGYVPYSCMFITS
jgi:hypothetical protein